MQKWVKLKDANGRGGVRYREHANRKHGAVPDRYYTLAYWWASRTITEGLGWASEGWTPSKCFEILSTLRHNQKAGHGPCTLKEMRELAEAEKEANRVKKAEAKRHTFQAFFYEIYLPGVKSREKKNCRTRNSAKAEQHFRLWLNPVVGPVSFNDIGLSHIQIIQNNLDKAGRSPRTQQYIFRTFAMIWGAAIDHGLTVKQSPTKFSSFKLPRVDNKRLRFLTLDEEAVLLDLLKSKDTQAYQMALVSLDAGLRWSEIAELTWDRVDATRNELIVMDSKGHDRIVPMTNRLIEMFGAIPRGQAEQLLFPDHQGQVHMEPIWPIRTAFIESGFNDGVTNRKMRASFHTLRHTYGSRLAQNGVGIHEISKLMGHSTLDLTERYAKLVNENLHAATRTLNKNIPNPTTAKNLYKRSGNGKVIPFKKFG